MGLSIKVLFLYTAVDALPSICIDGAGVEKVPSGEEKTINNQQQTDNSVEEKVGVGHK
jgi:hypothetical protein